MKTLTLTSETTFEEIEAWVRDLKSFPAKLTCNKDSLTIHANTRGAVWAAFVLAGALNKKQTK
jgi:hypothetical protein